MNKGIHKVNALAIQSNLGCSHEVSLQLLFPAFKTWGLYRTAASVQLSGMHARGQCFARTYDLQGAGAAVTLRLSNQGNSALNSGTNFMAYQR